MDRLSIQRLTYFAILVVLGVFVLDVGQSILAPLAFSVLFALMLNPIYSLVLRFIKWQVPSVILTLLFITVVLLGVIYFFYIQLVDVIQDMPSIRKEMQKGIATLYQWARNQFGYSTAEADQFLSEHLPKMVQGPLSFLGIGVSSSTSFFTSTALTYIYTFFFLLYRSTFHRFFMLQVSDQNKENLTKFIGKVQSIVQGYLFGLFVVILILGVLNSVGLWIIGIQYPMFWGFLAATLAIIPYLGTFLGGALPFLYSLATAGEWWQPLAIILLFIFIQTLEGNLITPKVVGSSIRINPLAAILALILGANLWGIAGMVLSLPVMAIFKEVLAQFPAWKPVSVLLSDDMDEDDPLDRKKWKSQQFRLYNVFKRNQTKK